MKRLACAMLAALAAMGATHAQIPAAGDTAWPTKPIRFIVPFPPGSLTDTAARVLGQRLSRELGQPLVVDNRSGASGNIGVEAAAKAPADGYTIVLGTTSTHAVAVSLNSRLAYDPIKDFAPVSLIATSPYVLVVHPSVEARSVNELIALARAQPKRLNYASAGPASLAHLAAELFAAAAGVELTHVPYRSSALAVVDLINGRIEMQLGTIAPTLPHIRSGKLRALGVTGATRLATLADVPTLAEAGLAGYEASLWMGILAPARTPAAIVSRLHREIGAALASDEVKDSFRAQGLEPASSEPQAFAAYIRSEIGKWRKAVQAAGVHPE